MYNFFVILNYKKYIVHVLPDRQIMEVIGEISETRVQKKFFSKYGSLNIFNV